MRGIVRNQATCISLVLSSKHDVGELSVNFEARLFEASVAALRVYARTFATCGI